MERGRRSPRVTACMPAWNAAAFIGPVLDSLAAQTYESLDVLISVDACDDGTGELCDAFAATHPRVRVVHQEARLGWIGNANALLAAVDTEYLFFAFHDDPLATDYAERLVDALERNPRAVLAFCDIDSNLGPFCYDELDGIDDAFERARRVLLRRGSWWVPNRGLIRATAAKTLGGMRPHRAGESSADLPWLLRLAILGAFVRVPERLIFKTFRPGGLSATWRNDTRRRIALHLACLEIIREAGFTPWQTLRLCAEAALLAIRHELRNIKQRLTQRAAASPRKRPVES